MFDIFDSSIVFVLCQGITKDLAQVSKLVKILHSYYALQILAEYNFTSN